MFCMSDIFRKRKNVKKYIIQNPGSLINYIYIYIYINTHTHTHTHTNTHTHIYNESVSHSVMSASL